MSLLASVMDQSKGVITYIRLFLEEAYFASVGLELGVYGFY